MIATLRALSALLDYPSVALQAGLAELVAALKTENLLDRRSLDALAPLVRHLKEADLLPAQEHYVEIFDRGRQHSLCLFEHVHGEARDRGQAMVDLHDRYVAAGLEPVSNDLPDFLPLFLEYCSTLSRREGLAELAETGPILALLAGRLHQAQTPYAGVLAALCHLAGVQPATPSGPAPAEDDLEELDKMWAEEAVRFGGPPTGAGMAPCQRAQAAVDRILTPRPTRAEGRSP